MLSKLYKNLIRLIYLPIQRRLARKIGCEIEFEYIPKDFIQGIARCNMTRTWKRANLDILNGQNYFTIGSPLNGTSTRFDINSKLYQVWLGGYCVKLASDKQWSVEEYCKLAVADQNSWLRWFGDPNPYTSIDGWEFKKAGNIQLSSGHIGTLFEGGFNSHSDVGARRASAKNRFAAESLAALYNLNLNKGRLNGQVFIPTIDNTPFRNVRGRVYMCIVDINTNTKVVSYANGISGRNKIDDSFELLKNDLRYAIESVRIIEL